MWAWTKQGEDDLRDLRVELKEVRNVNLIVSQTILYIHIPLQQDVREYIIQKEQNRSN